MKSKDNLGMRMKMYEQLEAGRTLSFTLPIICRIDGKKFSNFTKGLNRPYDINMSMTMQDTTYELMKMYHASVGYTQSDEITLIWYNWNEESEPLFGGRPSKFNSIIASSATYIFNRLKDINLPCKKDVMALFDCRTWNVPSLTEAANCITWRQIDARKNSISMAARSLYSHSELHGLSGIEMKKKLLEAGVDWDTYPNFFKYGTLFRRVSVTKDSEFGPVQRRVISEVERPIIHLGNKTDILFNEAPYETEQTT